MAPAAPPVLAMATAALTVATVVATLVPAIGANRIDPAALLREE